MTSQDIKPRIDPMLLLPEEPMTYEIKTKKKKKKKKKQESEDPLQGITESADPEKPQLVYELEEQQFVTLDPEITIKEEDLVLDYNEFANDDAEPLEYYGDEQEPAISLEPKTKPEGVILTFENVIKHEKPEVKQEKEDVKVLRRKTKLTRERMCNVCHLFFKNSRTLQIHQMKSHRIIRKNFIFKCKECNMAYSQKYSLDTHMRRKHSPNAVPTDKEERTCEDCGLVFKGMGRLRIHKQRKHGAFKDSFNFECKDCGLKYDKIRSLLVHRRRKHSDHRDCESDNYTCPFCSKVYDRRDTYARHMQRNHHGKPDESLMKAENFSESTGNGQIQCKQCPMVIANLTYLKLHMRRKHNEFKEEFRLKCIVCGLSYDKVESLKRHINRKHTDAIFCETCGKQFRSREDFDAHTHERKVIECTICGFIFASTGGLAKHMRCIHKINSNVPKNVTCASCKETFENNKQLKKHNIQVHLKIKYECKHCNKIYKSRDAYRKHALTVHQTNYPNSTNTHRCTICPSVFPSETALCRHMHLTHQIEIIKTEDASIVKKEVIENAEELDNKDQVFDKKNVIYRCTRCSHMTVTFEKLRQHYDKTHHKSETVQCPTCGEFVEEKFLPKHIKTVHPVIVNMKCMYCEFETTSRSKLSQHTLTHSNATSYCCDFPNCKYKSFYPEAMEKHKKKHEELGSAKLQCCQCPFQTMNKYILKYHEEEHATGEKKYKCDKCSYATILPANLVQHKYKHAQEKRFKCEYCPFASKYNTSLRFHVRKKHCDLPVNKI